MKIAASQEMKEYFEYITENVTKCYDLARKARAQGLDPEPDVAIPLANNMAERVVGLISVVAPQLLGTNLTQRITELESKFGMLDWRVGFKIAEEVAKESFCQFKDKKEAIEIGIRVGFAYLTLGIVSAPLEGFIGISIKTRQDGKEYFALRYAGPIRGAGGTAASTSVILADYVRVKMGYAPYDPTDKEVSRYTTEIHDYHERVTNLQYHPSDEELKFMISHLPVEVDGDPTEKFEVSNYKDIPRIETNLIRGGVALVVAEGLCQKSPKLWKRLSKWGKEFDLEWEWLKDFIELKNKVHAKHSAVEEKTTNELKANNTFIMDLVAGRPILTHPMGIGGFRLRYGRGRTSGFSASAVHPATLVVLDKYIAIGTQLKVERPGKAATITSCDTVDGPIVKLSDGSVLMLNDAHQARECNNDIEEILFLGDILFNYGDFSENGHKLVPAGYCPEWWAREVEKALTDKKSKQVEGMDESRVQELISKPLSTFPTFEEAIAISEKMSVPLHPTYLYYWKLVSGKKIVELYNFLQSGKIKKENGVIKKLILPHHSESHLAAKKTLEHLGIPHKIISKESILLEENEAKTLSYCFDLEGEKKEVTQNEIENKNGLEIMSFFTNITLRDKAGTFIGARMGRPEKAKMRHMTGSPQVMFPVGEQGGRLRSFHAALDEGKVRSAFPYLYCSECESNTIYPTCEKCGSATQKKYSCRFCGDLPKEVCKHGKGVPYKDMDIDIKYYFSQAKKLVGEGVVPDLIKGIRGTSNKNHVVENLAKGLLRAKHRIYVNKDGTTRYDCTELPLTHFKPKEIHTSVEKLKELGYAKDIAGKDLEDDDQILELKPQDIILPGFDSLEDSGPKVLSRVAKFIDDLLTRVYKLDSYYNIKSHDDLVGHLIIGLAPHISAALVGRIIGFSHTQGLLTHPMFHAGMRRDCDGDEACVMLLLDALLNFSRQYLPERRGAKTMDSPLVLTSILNPAEVDDQVHGMDVVWQYPLEFYEAALEMKNPWEVKVNGQKIEQLGDRLGKSTQYENFGFTHHVDDFNKAIQCSAYKTKPSMQEKLMGQMEIARKVRAVDMGDVAKLVIQKHFLKDIKGNLRKFSMQTFRCVKCNSKFRRPPLCGKCLTCGGKLIFTISQGSVVKYLKPSLLLADKYEFSPYLKETLDILQVQVDTVFGKEKEKQVGLSSFIQ